MLTGAQTAGLRLRLAPDAGTLEVRPATGPTVALIDLTTFEARTGRSLRLW